MERIDLEALLHRQWALPALAELHRSGGAGRLATLAHRLAAHRAALRQALDGLIALGLVARNPGHGHPARPEYLLTPAGAAAAPAADRVLGILRRRGLVDRCLRKWPLPVLHAVAGGAERYGGIRRRMPSITDRALAGALKDLEQLGLVKRRLVGEYPPVATYELNANAQRLVEAVAALARALDDRAGGAQA